MFYQQLTDLTRFIVQHPVGSILAVNPFGFIAQVVAPLVGRDYPETGLRQSFDLRLPAKPGVGESMQENDGFSICGISKGGVQTDAVCSDGFKLASI